MTKKGRTKETWQLCWMDRCSVGAYGVCGLLAYQIPLMFVVGRRVVVLVDVATYELSALSLDSSISWLL